MSFGTAGSLAANIDTLSDYEDDVLDFGGDAVLVGAGGSAVAATSVVTSLNGKVTFAADDDTLAEKIAAIRADTRLDAANSVAVFADGADSYVYYAGAATGNIDDQIVKLTGQSTLDKLVINAGNVTADVEPPSSGLTTTLSLLPTTSSWTGAPGGAAPTGFTPGNDGNANPAQGDGVNGSTNQLIRNASGTFGTHVQSGDDTYGLVAVPAALWSTGLNMFGTTYTNLYIGTNGYVTFGKGFSGYSPSGIAGFTRSPMIAAQYDDLYTDRGARNVVDGAGASGTSQNSHNMFYFIDGDKMVFTWDNVGLYSTRTSTTAGNVGSAFQIIIHKPTGDLAADQNFGMEIRYEEVTQQSPGATAGWTAGDKVNYGLVNDGVVLSTIATSTSNIGVNGGVVSAPYFLPDIGIGAGGVDVANLSFRNVLPTGFNITGDGNGYGFEMTAAVANGVNSSAVLNTTASPRWNLWKEQYKDGVATITVTPTGDANGAPVTMDINIFDHGLDTVTRVGGAAGTTLAVSATSSDLNNASNTDISTITTVQATAAVSIDLGNQTEDLTIAGSAGADTLVGGQGNDAINGGLGNDSLTGGGNDIFTVGLGAGTDTITDLGVGGDEIVVSSGIVFATLGDIWMPTSATSNSMGQSLQVNVNGFDVELTNTTSTQGWTLTNSGTAASMTGSSMNDNITGGTGDDTIAGNAGDDIITGGSGTDSLAGGAGDDTFRYATWADLSGETVNGGTHTTGDTIEFTSGISGENFHTAFGGVTNVERIKLFGANDINFGSSMLGTGITTILTGTGTTSIRNDDPALFGITIDAAAMTDNTMLTLTENGGGGTLAVTNLRGDLAAAAFGSGSLSATAASGAGFAVSMTGGGSTDTFIGGQGADTLVGNGGNDTLTGGAGADTFTVTSGTDTITDLGNGADILTVGGGSSVLVTAAGNFTATVATSNAGTASIDANGFQINMYSAVGSTGWNITNSGGGGIILEGSDTTNDTIVGGSGNESIVGRGGTNTLTGGGGIDAFVAEGNDTITDLGFGGADTLNAVWGTLDVTLGGNWTATAASIRSSASATNLDVAGFNVNLASISGTSGWNISNLSNADVSMTGSGNADSIIGGSGMDMIDGGAGDDTIIDDTGNDLINSGAGADSISLTNNIATSTDYIIYNTSGAFATDGPAAGADVGYDTITGFDGGDKDIIIFTGFVGSLTQVVGDTNLATANANQATDGDSIFAISDSAVSSTGDLTDNLAIALNNAFNLSGTPDGYYIFSIKAADEDNDVGTDQFWVGIYNDVGPDDLPVGAEIQVLALVTIIATGVPDYDNFDNSFPL